MKGRIKVQVIVNIDENEWKYSVTGSSEENGHKNVPTIIENILENIKERIFIIDKYDV